ncbi:MAG: TonB-dependent receptor [Saprospiraceae bacterium]|nr:TonB-dependent receptor [Saprospiraceae bacterium]MCF8251619.1 TonB-dependent receptor [Saprospiraceae bacterium]MCF8281340.1 TonB-dependent receptor [Bacteroidales bacterium]MCF8312291.1 TonB-dependent receptor [Saprospiraceae bacterium]MCF8441999.1 TonB-dependent receptor [Saprospiraceae bacterium]
MINITRNLISLVFLFISISLFSQSVIKGEVKDATTGEALIGASIFYAETGEGTVTDFDGSFELKIKGALPVKVTFSYTGYEDKVIEITDEKQKLNIKLDEVAITTTTIEVVGQRISEKQKASPLTVESMDLLAIKQTSSDNFYDGLGALKGVDLTAASLGFKIINTRGFNSTSPVRSLQLIDGVDNQAPGLNFSLGNFLGSSELDVMKVDMVQGASSAFYGPNAFNGVISMTTKSPFFHQGLSAMVKAGERNLLETAVRWADVFQNKNGKDVFGYKINVSYLRADDWEADNYDPVYNTNTGVGNPGGFDAVNIYGDEYSGNMDRRKASPWLEPKAMGQWHRSGYREADLVDYDTRNLKTNAVLHYRLSPSLAEASPEIIVGSSYSQGTTVYQGDNRFSLKDIRFYQSKAEIRKTDKYFLRAYYTRDDAGNSYDPYFTALRLQSNAKSNIEWSKDYVNYWRNNIDPRINELGYPKLLIVNGVVQPYDYEAAAAWLLQYSDSLTVWHNMAEVAANSSGTGGSLPFYEPGTDRFNEEFKRLTTAKSNFEEQGTRFYDKSALSHVQGEYTFNPSFFEYIKVGGSARRYTPNSEGTIFYDTADVKITNSEIGFYTGVEKKFGGDFLTTNATLRLDKNKNFEWLPSPALSIVLKPKANNYLRLSFSSAIRNPTLTDQYLFLNVGRAILAGNLDGVEGLYTAESFVDYINTLNIDTLSTFDIAGVKPEKVKTFEVGYRTTLWNSLYVDAGYYYSIYNDFLGYNVGVDAEFGAAGLPSKIQIYRYAANSINTVTTQGLSVGLSYYFASYFQFSSNYSWNKLNKEFSDDPIVPAFNTPEHKFNLGISGRNIPIGRLKNFGFNVNYKWIQGFLFEGSPQFTGFIPTYDLVDAQVNYNFKKPNITLKLGASNILNNKQFQAYGGPRIGRLAYISIVYEMESK